MIAESTILQATEGHATPFYLYDMSLLEQTLLEVKRCAGDYCVHYAIKANANEEIIRTVAAHGFGADCVSGGEVKLALACGIPAEKIAFAGVGKTDEEIRLAIEAGIGNFNVESMPELEVISAIATEMGRKARVALRVNPNIDAHTHHYITTGLAENKFGINLELLPRAAEMAKSLPGIDFVGLHFHIGSQVLDNEPFALLSLKINELQAKYPGLKIINVGGGLGIDYDHPDDNPIADFEGYFNTFRRNLHLRPGQQLHFELGRSIVAQCGWLISRVTYVKEGTVKKFVIVDAGMNSLLRPALYGAHHLIQNLSAAPAAATETYDVVGPICESSDVFATEEKLPATRRGDIIALRSAGAYGESMSSNYNIRPLQPAVFVK